MRAQFTNHPERLQRLKENYEKGVQVEALPLEQRRLRDIQALNPSEEHIRSIHRQAFADVFRLLEKVETEEVPVCPHNQ